LIATWDKKIKQEGVRGVTTPMKRVSSQKILKKEVLEGGLCTGCGACVALCPYQVIYHDRTVQLHNCDLENGKCYDFCPRTSTNLQELRNLLFAAGDLTQEIGALKGYYFSRATDSQLREDAQHGGTVTALMELALHEGLIGSAVISAQDEEFGQNGVVVKDKEALRKNAGSKFTVSPTVAAFHRLAAAKESGNIGVVATPCQALALAKMKLKAVQEDRAKIDQLKLVIGLYCGWTLAAHKFNELMGQHDIDLESISGMDIPAGKNSLEIYAGNVTKSLPLSDAQECIRGACNYCLDSTAEYADISVGAARFGENWEEMRNWNQVIVRTGKGRDLIELAIKRGVLEVKEAPAESLLQLKNAASEKKRTALQNIIRKTRSAKNLLYLDCHDPVVRRFLTKETSNKKSR
jgi:coenzyme F420 hydrogenase subunit beta